MRLQFEYLIRVVDIRILERDTHGMEWARSGRNKDDIRVECLYQTIWRSDRLHRVVGTESRRALKVFHLVLCQILGYGLLEQRADILCSLGDFWQRDFGRRPQRRCRRCRDGETRSNTWRPRAMS